MKKYLALILVLTLVAAVTAYPKDIRRVMAEKTMTAVTPSAKSYIMASYSTATGWDLRRMADTSVVKLGGMDTTAADGTRYVKPYNSVSFSGTPEEGMIQTTPTGLQIYLGGVWGEVSGAPAPMGIADLTDWPSDVAPQEVAFLNGLSGPVQDQIDALVAGRSDFVAPPAYSNSPCSMGQWSSAGGYHYDCIGTDLWDRFAYAGWVSTAPDTQPNIFTFTDKTNVALNTFVYSDTVQVNGLNTPAPISVTGGSYKIDSGDWQTAPGTISNGQWVSAGHTSASTGGTTTYTTVNIGGLEDTFASTTMAAVTADYIWPLNDNAATTTIVASSGGVNGTLSTGTTAAVQTGTPAFATVEEQFYNFNMTPNQSHFTIQYEMRYRGNAFGAPSMIFSSGGAMSLFLQNATAMKMYVNAGQADAHTSPNFAIPSVAADQVTWTVVRVVYDGTSIKVYTGTSEGTLGLRYTASVVITRGWGGTTKFEGWGIAAGNELRNIKIWNTAVQP